MWLHLLGKAYGKLPSEIVGLRHEWQAYKFDKCCLIAGLEEEEKALHRDSPSGARDRNGRFSKDPNDYRNPSELQGVFRQPMRKMKIPESGVW